MALTFTYRSPTTPAGPGWTEDLGNQAVRLGDIAGLLTSCELGAAAISSLRIDDPTGTAGHSGDAIVGLKQLSVTESAAPSGNRRVWEGYIADRTYYRGESSSPSLRTGAARIIDMSLVDLNTFLSFRVFLPTDVDATSDFVRPAETDVARVTALLAVDFISSTLFDNGLVSSSGPVNMDEVDYTGQRPVDVLNDCAQQSGKNFFVYYDESAGEFSLFYDFNKSPVYPASVSGTKVSNVLADVNLSGGLMSGPVWAPFLDAVLTRDPSRISAGVLIQNGSNSVYESDLDTSYAFAYRDMIGDSQNLKTTAQTVARANRYLSENAEEDDRIVFTLQLPKANVNDWKEGQYAPVKFSHLPGYEDYVNVRCLQRGVSQQALTPEIYYVRYECTPLEGEPSGATDAGLVGVSYSGTPSLPRATTPGNVLLAIMFAAGNTTRFPTAFRALDSPPVSPASPATPPFSVGQTAAWTIIGSATTDYKGQNIGGPCGGAYAGPYHGAAGTCTSGLLVAAAWRHVAPGEVTTKPAQFSTEITDSQTLTFLWELPTSTPPSGTFVESDGTGGGNPSTATLPTISGNSIAAINWALAAGHGAASSPTASSLLSGTSLRGPFQAIPGSHAPTHMNDPAITSNVQNWGWLISLPSGGVASARVTGANTGTPYNEINWCGMAIELPVGISLPDIPYPGNQSA